LLATPNRQRLEETQLGVNRDYLGALAAEGTLRPDLRLQDLDDTLPTIVFGFFAVEPFLPPAVQLKLGHRADQRAETVRWAFEPTGSPAHESVKRGVVKAIPIFERLARDYRAATRLGGSLSRYVGNWMQGSVFGVGARAPSRAPPAPR
jgi:hypothetical protein